MKRNKGWATRVIAALAMTLLLCACTASEGNGAPPAAASGGEQKNGPVIVTTIFPLYDWAKNIAGNHPEAEISLLLDNGVDLHSFQPTAQDVMKIATCDVFLYVGGESDEWVADALKEAVNPDMIAVNMLEALGSAAKTEEIVEGMEEDDHDHGEAEADGHDHDGDEAEDHDHEHAAYDEHVWLSLKNAQTLTGVIADAFSLADPAHEAQYAENLAAYRKKLSALDEAYKEAVGAGSRTTVLFGDRFPFRYLTDDYGLSYYAAFTGCSAETEASFETITFLSGKCEELDLNCVLMIEGSDGKIAQTIVDNAGSRERHVVALDSMQSTTARDVAEGADYLSIMEKNLEALKEALE